MKPGFRLDGGGQSAVFLIGDGPPRLAYWGQSLGAETPWEALAVLLDRPQAPSQVDGGQSLTWLPEAGRGFAGWPGVEGHRDGVLLVTRLRPEALEATPSEASLDLADPAARVTVRLTLAIDPETGVLESRVRLENTGETPLCLDWLAAGAVPARLAEIMTFDGRWGREFIPVRQSLLTGLMMKENRTGRTSHHAPPFLFAGEAGFGEASGEVVCAHLAWSGDHRLFAERLRDGLIQLQAGELLHPGEVILGPGEAYETPSLYLARSEAGLGGLSDRLHPFVRRRILGGRLERRPRPVVCNTWEAVYFDHDTERLRALAERAAEVGVERFVLDDGWFRGRTGDGAGLGDWTADPERYPDGLGPLIAHVRSLGMEFGLWIEPEMVNADSDLLRAHPDWILGDPDQPLGRHQFVLDLTRPEVWHAIFVEIDTPLRDHPIAFLKWDMNRDLTAGTSGGRAATHRQTLAVYALIDALRAAHPTVEIESCASGGGRADYAILARAERIWTSDCNDPIERQAIQRGASIVFPPEAMGAHVGPRASHTTARSASLRLRALTAMVGHMGVEADLTAMDEAERAELAEAIALHKRLRPLLHAGRLVRLEHPDPGCVAQAVIGEAAAFVTAAQVATPLTATLAPLRLRGLEADAAYRIESLHPPRRPRPTLDGSALLSRGEPIRAAGRLIAEAGLPLPALRAGDIAAFALTRESS